MATKQQLRYAHTNFVLTRYGNAARETFMAELSALAKEKAILYADGYASEGPADRALRCLEEAIVNPRLYRRPEERTAALNWIHVGKTRRVHG